MKDKDRIIETTIKLLGEVIDNYEADAINLPAQMYNDLKSNWKQLRKIAEELSRIEPDEQDDTKKLLADIISWELDLGAYPALETILRDRYNITLKTGAKPFTKEEIFNLIKPPQAAVMPTDGEIAIELLARFTGNSRGLPIARKSFIDACLWYKSQVKVVDQMDVLIKYSEWWDKKYNPSRLDFHRKKDINTYLASKND